MTKICDHTSVGIIVRRGEEILLIERKKFPFGFAPPSGHVDLDPDYETAAKRELKEEVGLEVVELNLLIEGKKENKCRRDGGTWHYWKIYQAEVQGDIVASSDETKQVGWFSPERIRELSDRTGKYLSGEITEKEWEESPGIEVVWYEWFKELEII